MEQKVKVHRVFQDGTAEVVRVRESACSGDCHKCSGCGAQQQTMLVTAQNPLGAAVGDMVIIESESGPLLKAAVILYILPLVLFLAGYMLGEHFWQRGILVSIIGFALGMVPIKLCDRYMAKKNTVYTIKRYAKES